MDLPSQKLLHYNLCCTRALSQLLLSVEPLELIMAYNYWTELVTGTLPCTQSLQLLFKLANCLCSFSWQTPDTGRGSAVQLHDKTMGVLPGHIVSNRHTEHDITVRGCGGFPNVVAIFKFVGGSFNLLWPPLGMPAKSHLLIFGVMCCMFSAFYGSSQIVANISESSLLLSEAPRDFSQLFKPYMPDNMVCSVKICFTRSSNMNA